MATKKRTTRPFEVRESKIQGRGVFATRKIRRGHGLIEYRARSSTRMRRTAAIRGRRRAAPHVPVPPGQRVVIDAGPSRGNAAKYINHSCDPNCEAVEEDGRIFIYAIRDIRG
jgi:uncharacterized protein